MWMLPNQPNNHRFSKYQTCVLWHLEARASKYQNLSNNK